MVLYDESDMASSAVNREFNRRLAEELAEMKAEGVWKKLQHIIRLHL